MQVINPVPVAIAATLTRASTGNVWDIYGALVSKAINEARFQWNPATGVFEGVLWEPARTNLFLYSATPASPNWPQTRSVTVSTVYTVSFYGTGSIAISGTTTVDGVSAASRTVNGSGATTRTTLTFTAGAASLTFTHSGSVTKAQLEAGAFATSYITTTTATASRSAEVFSGEGMFNTTFVDATAAYAGGTTYARGAQVQSGYRLYESMHASNTGNTPVSTADAYNPAATYVIGDQVMDDNDIVYTSLQNANTGNTPATSPTWWTIHWLDIGPLNQYAMFDREQTSTSLASNGYPVFAFYTSSEVNAVAFHGIEADTVHVAVSNGAGGLATQSVQVSGKSAWCGDLAVPGGTTGGAVVSVYCTRASGSVSIAEFVPGTIHTLGESLVGTRYGAIQFGTNSEDAWGRVKYKPTTFRKTLSAPVLVELTEGTEDLNNIAALLDYLRGKPCSWSLLDDPMFAYIGTVYGPLIDHSVQIEYRTAVQLNLEVKGLLQD